MEWHPLALSFEVAGIAVLVAGTVGICLAALIALWRFPGRDLLDCLLTAPLVMPPTVLGYYVLVALGRRSPLGHAFEALTGATVVFTFTGAVVAAAIGALPFIVKSSRAALEEVDPTLVNAAATLGAGPLRVFLIVRLPLAMRGVAAGLMLGFAKSLGDFGVTLMVAGDIPGETQTASLAIYDAISGGREPQAAGMVAVLSALAVVSLYGVNKLVGRRHVF
jgi:molybdate transport system permease protein